MTEEIVVFSDGASKGNPGPGGWGAVVVAGGDVVELGGRETYTTNNRMELVGAIKALENFASKKISASVTLYTDSRYVINGITKWISNWKKRDWKTLQKEDVVNRDLWEKLDLLVENFRNNDVKIKWVYVGGHIGIVGNERVDEIASSFATGDTPTLFSGKISEYKSDIKNVSLDERQIAQKKDKSEAKSRSRAKAYSYVSMVNGVVKTHTTWAECEKHVKGVRGAKFKKALSASDEKAIIADWKKL